MYKNEKSHARAKEQFLLSVTDPLGFLSCVTFSIGIKFKNGLKITNQTHILFRKLLISMYDTC